MHAHIVREQMHEMKAILGIMHVLSSLRKCHLLNGLSEPPGLHLQDVCARPKKVQHLVRERIQCSVHACAQGSISGRSVSLVGLGWLPCWHHVTALTV